MSKPFPNLEPIVLKGKKNNIVIGLVDEIHRKGKEHKFNLTEAEAEILVKHWANEILMVEEEFAQGSSSSSGIRMLPYADSRIESLIDSGAIIRERAEQIMELEAEGYYLEPAQEHENEKTKVA